MCVRFPVEHIACGDGVGVIVTTLLPVAFGSYGVAGPVFWTPENPLVVMLSESTSRLVPLL
jgi:hypothetical protein